MMKKARTKTFRLEIQGDLKNIPWVAKEMAQLDRALVKAGYVRLLPWKKHRRNALTDDDDLLTTSLYVSRENFANLPEAWNSPVEILVKQQEATNLG